MKKGTKYKPGQNKGGRPKIEFDPDAESDAEEFSGFGATNEEIASHLGIPPTTLDRRFGESIKRGRLKFHTSLRRLQARSAKGYWEIERDSAGKEVGKKFVQPSWAMQIWLGKQYLNQKDRIEQDVNQNLHEFRIEVIDEATKKLIESGEFFTAIEAPKEVKQIEKG